jgi:hypothetical protein
VALPGITPVAAKSVAAPRKAPAPVPEATRPPAPAAAGVLALVSYAFTNNAGRDVVGS